MEVKQLTELYLHEVRNLLSAENQILAALPKVAELASSNELKASLELHQKETEQQRDRLIKAIELLGEKPDATECKAMKGLLQEGKKLAGQVEEGPLRDLAIIGATRKVEHYEISGYSSLVAIAETLDLDEHIELLDQTLAEEKETARKLTALAVQSELPKTVDGALNGVKSTGQKKTEKETDSMRTSERERDEQGRFTSDDDRGGRSSSRGRDDDDRGRGSNSRERNDQGRFVSDDDRGGRSGNSSRSRDDDDDRGGRGGSSRGRDDDGRGWHGDSRGHSEAARRGWEDRDDRGSSRGRDDDDDRGGRGGSSNRDRDDRGRFTSDDDRGGRGSSTRFAATSLNSGTAVGGTRRSTGHLGSEASYSVHAVVLAFQMN